MDRAPRTVDTVRTSLVSNGELDALVTCVRGHGSPLGKHPMVEVVENQSEGALQELVLLPVQVLGGTKDSSRFATDSLPRWKHSCAANHVSAWQLPPPMLLPWHRTYMLAAPFLELRLGVAQDGVAVACARRVARADGDAIPVGAVAVIHTRGDLIALAVGGGAAAAFHGFAPLLQFQHGALATGGGLGAVGTAVTLVGLTCTQSILSRHTENRHAGCGLWDSQTTTHLAR